MPVLDGDADSLRYVLDRVGKTLEECAIRGTRVVGDEGRRRLQKLCDEVGGLGASHLAGRLGALERALGEEAAPMKLMEAQTALRLLVRVATLNLVTETLEDARPLCEVEAEDEDDTEGTAP